MKTHPGLKTCLHAIAVAAAYYALARVGLAFAHVSSNASPLWPAAGFALAAVMLWGPRAAFGIFIGAWLANNRQFLADHSASPFTAWNASTAVALGNVAEAWLGAALLRRIGSAQEVPRRTREAALFCVLAPVIGLISPCVGPVALTLGGILPPSRLFEAGLTWWIGDTIGILVMTPLILAWLSGPAPTAWPTRAQLLEGAAAGATLALGAWLGCGGRLMRHPQAPLSFATFPALFWILFRFGPRASTAALAALACAATWMTTHGGTFAVGPTIQDSLMLSASYLAVLSVTATVARAIIEERREAMDELRRSHEGLERHAQEQGQGLRLVNAALDLAAIKRQEDKARVQLYKNVFDSLPIGVMVLRLEAAGKPESLRILEINSTGLRLSESRRTSASDLALRDFSPEICGTELPAACVEVMASGEGRVFHELAFGKDASERRFHVRLFPVSEESVGIAFETATDQKAVKTALGESESLQRLMIESVQDYAIFRLDRDGRVASWNSGAQLIEGYRAEEIIGSPHSRFFSPEDVDHGVPQEQLKKASREGRCETEGWRLRKDGSRLWAHVVLAAIRDEGGALLGYVKVVHDATQRRKIQQALETRTEALVRSNAELSQFAYVASHDLNEPLHKVAAFADRLKEKLDGKLDEEGVDFMRRMLRAIGGMQSLIDDLLQLARVTTSGGKAEVVDLAALARDVLDSLGVSVLRLGGRVDIGPLPRIHADPLQMRQLLQNLLSNALKFRKADRRPHVRIHGQATGDGRCVLVVTDDGIGFEMKYCERIFKPFQRLHGRMEYEGTGMGLAICKKIVERHGGTIAVASAPNRGSEFTVNLPISQDGRTECSPLEKAYN